MPPQHASQCTLPKKLTEIHRLRYNTALSLLHENPNNAIGREF